MKRVFVSYSRNNIDIVKQLIADLEAMGINTWHDQTLAGGQRWWENILANIRECDIFVFALSPESWDSEACRSELDYVVRLQKPILPVQVADGINMNLLTAPLNEIQVMDYRESDKEAAFALVKSINTASPAPELPDPLPDSPPVPVSYLSTLKQQIDSAQPLSEQAQITLLFELEESLREGRSRTEIVDLLLRFKRRDELLAKIAVKVDAALQSLESKPEPKVTRSEVKKPVGLIHRTDPATKSSTGPKFCPQCGTGITAGARFCPQCGNNFGGAGNPQITNEAPDAADRPSVEGAKVRRFGCPPDESPVLIEEVMKWLDAEDFDTQQVNMEDHSLLLQIKKRGGWRDYVGMSTSLNIVFRQSGENLVVEIGGGKWIDKAAVGTVSMFILWPLAITAGYGAWEQMKMPERIFDFIGKRLAYS